MRRTPAALAALRVRADFRCWKYPSQVLPAALALSRGRASISRLGMSASDAFPRRRHRPAVIAGRSGSLGERLQSIPPAVAGSRSLVKNWLQSGLPRTRQSSPDEASGVTPQVRENMTWGCPEAAVPVDPSTRRNPLRLRKRHVKPGVDSFGRGFGKAHLGLDDGRNPRRRCY